MNVDTIPKSRAASMSAEELKKLGQEIENSMKQDLKVNDVWYLIDIQWFKQFIRYASHIDPDTGHQVEINSDHFPRSIDNSSLLEGAILVGEFCLSADKLEGLHYVLVPNCAWHRLKDLFGICDGQSEIARHVVVEYGMFVKQTKVEVYPLEVFACLSTSGDVKRKVIISRTKRIVDFLSKIRETFSLGEDTKFRLFVKLADNTCELFDTSKGDDLLNCGLNSGQLIIVDVQSPFVELIAVDRRFIVVSGKNAQPIAQASNSAERSNQTEELFARGDDENASLRISVCRANQVPLDGAEPERQNTLRLVEEWTRKHARWTVENQELRRKNEQLECNLGIWRRNIDTLTQQIKEVASKYRHRKKNNSQRIAADPPLTPPRLGQPQLVPRLADFRRREVHEEQQNCDDNEAASVVDETEEDLSQILTLIDKMWMERQQPPKK